MTIKTIRFALAVVLLATQAAQAIGYGDARPRAMGLAGSYTALARGVESLYWNPANLALKDGPKVSIPMELGFSYVLENNSWSVSTYNDFNGDFIDEGMKDDMLSDLGKEGLQFNTDLGLFVPLVGGVAFPMPWGISSAMALDVRMGVEGQIPRDMIEFMLRGNQFERERIAAGRDPNYDIAEWDGEAWALGVFSWGFAKPWIPPPLAPYVSQFAVGTTLKVMGGGLAEVTDSEGGFVTRVSGTEMSASGVARHAFGIGFGMDLGAVGVTKDGRTTVGLSLVNLLDAMNWSIEGQQDSVYVTAIGVSVTSFTGKDGFDEIFDNPREVTLSDGRIDTVLEGDVDAAIWDNGDPVFRTQRDIDSFSRSLPAMLRLGVAHTPFRRLTVALNYDQAFSSGMGIDSTPRVSLATEYRLVNWFPLRFGLSGGGRAGRSSAIGISFGPFNVKRFEMVLMEMSVSNRGGFFPGSSQGLGYSVNLLRMHINH
ncbi:MAG TPA: hypothetical protein DIC52_15825 [Candidatus Latescibacteria bacterium]|nr:hypothetical protein [Candidatus Latescibacterota bacterium]